MRAYSGVFRQQFRTKRPAAAGGRRNKGDIRDGYQRNDPHAARRRLGTRGGRSAWRVAQYRVALTVPWRNAKAGWQNRLHCPMKPA